MGRGVRVWVRILVRERVRVRVEGYSFDLSVRATKRAC